MPRRDFDDVQKGVSEPASGVNGHAEPEASLAPKAPEGETWTVRRLLTWTTEYLGRKGSGSARLDAEVLLAQVLNWPRVQLYTHFESVVGEKERTAFRELVRRRAEGTPVAYLVGRKEFFSLTLKVSPAVLIPRPDTETVVVEFLALFKGVEDVRAVDVGTGSGAIALACVHQHRSARFVATDLSVEALEVARTNAEKLKLGDRLEFRQGDLYAPVEGEPKFDAIVSNPPYIATEDIATLEPGVRDHEPRQALDGGIDGLDVVARLIRGAPERLRPGGHLILEIGTEQEGPVRALIEEQEALTLFPTVKDAANHPRVIRATRK